MNILVAMSGGVDSSVAAALLVEQGHAVAGATLRLWGGESDSGCCSVSDVDDARRVAQQLGIEHWVFNMSDEFDRLVVDPYVADHAVGRTPNPCVECNRHLKFDALLTRADRLGFDAVATGHYVRRVLGPEGRWQISRAVDPAKDQSYVLHMLSQETLARTLFPLGDLPKSEVRARATALGLRTADKPDSQDVCFIAKAAGGRSAFLGRRIELHPAEVVSTDGTVLGSVPAVEAVTIGQRRGLGVAAGSRRFVVDVDVPGRKVVVGTEDDLLVDTVRIAQLTWIAGVEPEVGSTLLVQSSAHGEPVDGIWDGDGVVKFWAPRRRVASGQSVVLYEADIALGGGVVV